MKKIVFILPLIMGLLSCNVIYSAYNERWGCVVTFDSQGADAAAYPTVKLTTVYPGTVGTLPAIPVKAGYRFSGWFTGVNGTGTQLTAATHVMQDMTVYAYWDMYKVGDKGPAGGWIFYINPLGTWLTDGWRYIEAAPYDQSDNAPWVPASTCYVITVRSGFGKTFGDANTTEIITNAGNSGTYAAKLCADLVIGVYDDWYQPTDVELAQMNINLHLKDIGNFANNEYYWSSVYGWNVSAGVEASLNLQFKSGSSNNGSPQTQYGFRTRAVRAFL